MGVALLRPNRSITGQQKQKGRNSRPGGARGRFSTNMTFITLGTITSQFSLTNITIIRYYDNYVLLLAHRTNQHRGRKIKNRKRKRSTATDGTETGGGHHTTGDAARQGQGQRAQVAHSHQPTRGRDCQTFTGYPPDKRILRHNKSDLPMPT